MPQLYTAMPTLIKSKVSRIVLSSLIVVTALVVLGNMTGAIVDEKLHVVIAISGFAAIVAGLFHEHLLMLSRRAENTSAD
ncbi:MAG: hypothetical protein NXH95_17845 [Pseudomonadaceae bacterium]|nr:hypothetical protein [Pseudomonadaceae bacterium]